MKKRILGILGCLVAFSSALIGGGSTGGGNAVVCTEPLTGFQTVRLLDYYEADLLLPDLDRDLGPGGTPIEKVEYVLTRLKGVDASRAKTYQQEARNFMRNTRFVKNVVLPEIKDHGFVALGQNCVLKQVAVQNLAPLPEAKKFTISQELWDKLSVDDRAGLILHEIIFEEALRLGQTNSRNSRYYNALISSRQSETLSTSEYETRLASVGLAAGPGYYPPGGGIIEFPHTNLSATEGNTLSFDLAAFALRQGAGALTFKKLSGPSWIFLTTKGILAGTPEAADIGVNEIDFEIEDGKVAERFKFSIVVNGKASKEDLPVAIADQYFSFDAEKLFIFETNACSAAKLRVLTGPKWLQVRGDSELVGTPRASDVGVYQLTVEYEFECKRLVDEYAGGKVIQREVLEAVVSRRVLKGKVSEEIVLKAGRLVPSGEYDEVLQVEAKSGRCQAVLIGPRVYVAPAYCFQAGASTRFKFKNRSYGAKFFADSNTGIKAYEEIGLGLVSQDVVDSDPFTIGGAVTKGSQVEVLTYPSQDNHLYTFNHVVDFVGQQLRHREVTGARSVWFGNSGAPVLVGTRFKWLTGIVSAINPSTGDVYSTPLTSNGVMDYLKAFAKQHQVKIHGVNVHPL